MKITARRKTSVGQKLVCKLRTPDEKADQRAKQRYDQQKQLGQSGFLHKQGTSDPTVRYFVSIIIAHRAKKRQSERKKFLFAGKNR